MSLSYSPLLAWAIATGRIDEDDRGKWVNHLVAGREAAVVETILAAAPDLKLGDFPAPHPWGIGDPATCASRDTARIAAKRGRNVFASKGTHRPASPYELRQPIKASTTPPSEPAGSLSSVVDVSVSDVSAPAGPRPKLFGDRDLPAVMASGLDPKLLLEVPEAARPAMARAETSAQVAHLVDWYGGPDGEIQAAVDALGDGPLAADAADYQQRVTAWGSQPAGDPNRGHGLEGGAGY